MLVIIEDDPSQFSVGPLPTLNGTLFVIVMGELKIHLELFSVMI